MPPSRALRVFLRKIGLRPTLDRVLSAYFSASVPNGQGRSTRATTRGFKMSTIEGDWTSSGIGYCMVAIARDDLLVIAKRIEIGDNVVEDLSTVIRQLEAARRMLV